MPESPIYDDYLMASRTDDFFRWLTIDADPPSNGEVDAPTGWFGLVHPTHNDVVEGSEQLADGWITHNANLPTDCWYLVQIDTQGLVWTHSYAGLDGLRPEPQQHRRALADFSRLTRMYHQWLDEPVFSA